MYPGGPLPFRADDLVVINDSRNCLHWYYRDGSRVWHRTRGSKPDYPISDPDLVLEYAIGCGSVTTWEDGWFQVEWPTTGKAVHLYKNPLDYPNPSAGQVVKLDPNLRVPEMVDRFGHPITICPTLIPTYGIEKSLDENLFCDRYLNRGATGGHFNAMRFFSFGVWEPFTIARVNFPYLKVGDKFDTSLINPEWIETLKRRIKQAVDRGYTVIITLTDNCSTHDRPDGWWGAHPWNGDNNVNGTSNWDGSVYHFYEDDKQSMPGIPESWMAIEFYVRYIVSQLDPLFRPYIIWEICNESHAGEGYHKLQREWLSDSGVTEDWRVMTSMDGMEHHGDFPFLKFYKKQMWQYLRYAVHNIQTVDKYVQMKDDWMRPGVRFQASEDGLRPIDASQYREFVRTILEDGALGFESNERPWWYHNVFNPDLWNWARISEIGKGFRDFVL